MAARKCRNRWHCVFAPGMRIKAEHFDGASKVCRMCQALSTRPAPLEPPQALDLDDPAWRGSKGAALARLGRLVRGDYLTPKDRAALAYVLDYLVGE